jgi:hypothetical protein
MPEPKVQRQEYPTKLRTKSFSDLVPEVCSDLESRINTARGGGRPLSENTRAFFESRFGYDFGDVRVHMDAEADILNRALKAEAFTSGEDVFFSRDTYMPDSSSGRQLLAHELTHVLQQCNVTPQPGVDTTQSDDGIGHGSSAVESASQDKELMPAASLQVQRFPFDVPDPFRPVDAFIQQFIDQLADYLEDATIGRVERACQWVIRITGADAVVLSLSGLIGTTGPALEAGVELIYARDLGWLTYGHFGGGLATPGPSVAVEVGLIWNLTDPGAYTGAFMELAASYYVAGSMSGVPSAAGREEENPWGVKFGIGTPGGAILYEHYLQISGQRQPAVAR